MSKAKTLASVVSTGGPLDDGQINAADIADLTLPSGGSIVGTTDTQTLTNKTIDGASNTLSNVNLASQVTGTLPVASGGTGATSLTANNVLLGNGTSALQAVAPGSSGNVLTSNGTTWTSAAASSGALTLLATSTVSGTPQNLDITWSGTTYDDYLIIAENFSGNATHRYAFRFANSSGTFITGGSYYARGIKWESTAQAVTAAGSDYIEPFANNSSTTNVPEGFGYFYVLNANASTAFASSITFNWTQNNSSNATSIQGTSSGGMTWNLASGFRGFRVFDVVGNGLKSGTLRLYGVQK